MKLSSSVVVIFAISQCMALAVSLSPSLGSWNIDMDHVTVSGFSGGAGFSTQASLNALNKIVSLTKDL